ncbi:MAG: hypothetical protein JSR46_05875 [Verrucomicrobia bacterium]|nr:hypothetical protein [Verrucomicrobiota bacterium]
MITDWSLQFFQPMTQRICTAATGEESKIKKEIELEFNSHRQNWEKYFIANDVAVLTYLEGLY